MTATSSATIGLNSGDDFTITSLSGNVTTTSDEDTTINAGQDLTLSSTRYFALDSSAATTSNSNNIRRDVLTLYDALGELALTRTNLLQHGRHEFTTNGSGSGVPLFNNYRALYNRVGNCVTVHGFFQLPNGQAGGVLSNNLRVPLRAIASSIVRAYGTGTITNSGENLLGVVRIGQVGSTSAVEFTFCPVILDDFTSGGPFNVEFTYQYIIEG